MPYVMAVPTPSPTLSCLTVIATATQTAKVTVAIATTIGMNHEATLSARSWTRGLTPRAVLTRVLMSEMVFAFGRRVTWMSKLLVPPIVPAIAASPFCFFTGSLSPVSMDSSTALDPEVTMPSLLPRQQFLRTTATQCQNLRHNRSVRHDTNSISNM